MKVAMHWAKEGNKVRCSLCNHKCLISEGRTGTCGVRKNLKGKLYSLIYEQPISFGADPIEKKPLFHFHPGSRVLSFGSVGCTFGCEFCQNSDISQAEPGTFPGKRVKAKDLPQLTRNNSCSGVAWTYNEPTIWHEWALEGMQALKKEGLYTVYVSNGYIQEEPLRELKGSLDAINIDVKAFTDEFYRKYVKGRIEPVLNSCRLAMELGIFLELTYLVIPTLNDDPVEIRKFADFVANDLGPDVPVHFSRFHPDYRMRNLPPTPFETLVSAYKISKEAGLNHVYVGNVPGTAYENTICPQCGKVIIERTYYRTTIVALKGNSCAHCGKKLNIVV